MASFCSAVHPSTVPEKQGYNLLEKPLFQLASLQVYDKAPRMANGAHPEVSPQVCKATCYLVADLGSVFIQCQVKVKVSRCCLIFSRLPKSKRFWNAVGRTWNGDKPHNFRATRWSLMMWIRMEDGTMFYQCLPFEWICASSMFADQEALYQDYPPLEPSCSKQVMFWDWVRVAHPYRHPWLDAFFYYPNYYPCVLPCAAVTNLSVADCNLLQ